MTSVSSAPAGRWSVQTTLAIIKYLNQRKRQSFVGSCQCGDTNRIVYPIRKTQCKNLLGAHIYEVLVGRILVEPPDVEVSLGQLLRGRGVGRSVGYIVGQTCRQRP